MPPDDGTAPKRLRVGGRRGGGGGAGNSLRMQALGFLSRREHSRQELRGKLLLALKRRAAANVAASADDRAANDVVVDADADAEAESPPAPSTPEADPATEVDALLDWLEARGYLSDARFIESRVHARAARQGGLRIRAELARHGLSLDADQAATLRDSEFARAQAVWQRKFGGQVAADARGRAAQARFLAARGFSAEVVRRIVGGEDEF